MTPLLDINSLLTETSMPVVWTGVYPHMPIADHRETQIVYNTLRLRPCRGLFFTAHTVRGSPAKFVAPANDRRTCYQFFNFWPRGLTHGPKFTKGEMTYYPPGSTILQNFRPIAQTVYKICVTKVFFPLFGLEGANSWAEVHQKGG